MPWIIQVIVALAIVGLVLWVIEQIPMDATIARIIRVVVIVAVCIWLLTVLVSVFGGGASLFPATVPKR
jgi:hypothetical protein